MLHGIVFSICLFISICGVSSNPTYQYCCNYCRGDPKSWIKSASTFRLNPDNDITRMSNPPAYMVNDQHKRQFKVESRAYELRYSGAPLRIKHQSIAMSDEILNEQFIQFDLATPKAINGILTQGGYYEETVQNLIPRAESWVDEYIVSFSNDSEAKFTYATDEKGDIQILTGPSDYHSPTLESFAIPPVARYLRFHPLGGRTEGGAATDVSVRVTPVTCTRKPCVTPKINCLMTPWSSWSSCECSGGSCTKERDRVLLRLQACGGANCGDTIEQETCTPSQPAWIAIVQYLGIGLLVIVVVCVAVFVVYRKKSRDRVEVIVVREGDDDDDDDDEEATPGDFKAAEARGMYPPGGMHFMPPPFAAPPSFHTSSNPFAGGPPPPSYSSGNSKFAGIGGMGGVTPLDTDNTFIE